MTADVDVLAGLTEAWNAAQDSLPPGYFVFGVRAAPLGDAHFEESTRYAVDEPVRPLWWTAAARGEDPTAWITGGGPTPPEALLVIANRDAPVIAKERGRE